MGVGGAAPVAPLPAQLGHRRPRRPAPAGAMVCSARRRDPAREPAPRAPAAPAPAVEPLLPQQPPVAQPALHRHRRGTRLRALARPGARPGSRPHRPRLGVDGEDARPCAAVGPLSGRPRLRRVPGPVRRRAGGLVRLLRPRRGRGARRCLAAALPRVVAVAARRAAGVGRVGDRPRARPRGGLRSRGRRRVALARCARRRIRHRRAARRVQPRRTGLGAGAVRPDATRGARR